ncbi:hypothetical protein [Paenibacillus sp. TSA_86.1]|uniref:hypothetical protein n=1 Tax=Paenibacillus sp. TSA_86.1 TaxID=3415649 RepID=UPI004045AFA4
MGRNPFVLLRENSLEKEKFPDFDATMFSCIAQKQKSMEQFKLKAVDEIEKLFSATKHPGLLNMKRCVFNHKINKVEPMLNTLSGELNVDFIFTHKYIEEFREFMMLERSAKINYETELDKLRESMVALLKEQESVLSGLLMINPDIYYKLDSYLNTPVSQHRNKQRKLETTIYKFITRSAYKTSPFLSITRVGRSEISNEPVVEEFPPNREYTNKVSLNFTLLYRLTFHFLMNSDVFLKTIGFYMPPFSIRAENGKQVISFLSRKDLPSNNKLFMPSEQLAEMKIPLILAELFEERDMENEITFSDCMSLFSNSLTENQLCQLLRKYLSIGLLVPAVAFNEGSSDLFLADIKKVTKKYLQVEEYTKLNDILNQINETVQEITNQTTYKEKHLNYKRLEEIMMDLGLETGFLFPAKTVFYEDGLIEDIQHMESSDFEKITANFKNIQVFSIIFDVNIRMQYAMGTRLYEQFQDNLADIDSDFFSVLFDVSKEMIPYWEDVNHVDPSCTINEIVILDQLKLKFIDELNELDELSIGEVEMDVKQLIDKYIKLIPERILKSADLTSSFFVQLNGNKAILNAVYDGHEKYKARFMNYFTDYLSNDNQYMNFIKDYYEDQNYYEFSESFGFNGNVKNIKLDNQCYTGGIGSKRFLPEAKQAYSKIEDFKIKIDRENKKFRIVDMHNNTVKICYRGSLVPTSMPGYISVLLQLFSSGSLMFKFSDLIRHEQVPRISYGDTVLSRRRINLTSFVHEMERNEMESNYEYFRRINILFVEKKLNKRFFIAAKRGYQFEDAYLREFKPLYIDITNPIALTTLEKEILSKKELGFFSHFYIEEYLSNSGKKAQEYDIEIYKKEGEGIEK